MKNILRFMFVLVVVLSSVVLIYSNYSNSGSAAAAASNNDETVSPRSLFVQNCSRCHGSNGRGQTRLGKKLEADDLTGSEAKGLSTARVIRLITNGKGKMPSFRRKLTAAQISSLADYIRSL